MGRKDWVSGDLMERAEVGTLGHLLCVIFQLGNATGMEASFGRGGQCLFSRVSCMGLSC